MVLRPAHRTLLSLLRPTDEGNPPCDSPLGDFDRDVSSRPAGGADRAELLDLLGRHGLAGWAHGRHRDAGVELPPDLAVPLAEAHRLSTAQGILALAAFDRLSALLSARGIPHVPLKGASLLRTLYPDPGTRPLCDLDVLVPLDDIDRADAALRGAGYAGEPPAAFRRQRRYHHHHGYDAPPPFAVHVELHFLVSARGLGRGDGDPLWARTSPVAPGSFERAFSPSAAVFALARHLGNHGYAVSLKWLLDLRLLSERSGPAIEPAAVAALAAHAGSLTACAFGLALAVDLAGAAALEPSLRACLARLPPLRRPVLRALASPEWFFDRAAILRRKWPAHAFSVWLGDDLRGRLGNALRAIRFKLDLEGVGW
jgi:hypothetical protein